nr:MAG TPA: hypothetical protein [Caudoviricetes sp.]
MKYLYKNTCVIVESGRKLDSAVFTPYEECNTENPVNDTENPVNDMEKAETESKQPKRKPAAKK